LHRPNPKGGKERAFTIPLSSECVRILQRRKIENRVSFASGDGGWVFPTRALKDKSCALCTALGQGGHVAGSVVHLIEGKQQQLDKKTGERKQIVPSPHRLRDTYTSALVEVGGISPFVIDVLTNHRPPRGSVTAGYVDLSIDHAAVRSATARPRFVCPPRSRRCAVLDPDNFSAVISRACAAHLTAVYAAVEMANDS
jgi:integrase